MHFLEYYYQNIIQYDLLNKFRYKNIKKLPKLQKIVLNFGCKNSDIKNLSTALLSLELITNKRGNLIVSKNSNILLKIKKGNPVGCKVILKKTFMYNFFAKILINIFPRIKNFTEFNTQKNKLKNNAFSYKLTNALTFLELEQNYYLFNNLPNLNITVTTNTKTKKELVFLLHSFKLPLTLN